MEKASKRLSRSLKGEETVEKASKRSLRGGEGVEEVVEKAAKRSLRSLQLLRYHFYEGCVVVLNCNIITLAGSTPLDDKEVRYQSSCPRQRDRITGSIPLSDVDESCTSE